MSASDIASLMPSGGSDEGISLMPKMLELQTKMNGLEGIILFLITCGFLIIISQIHS